MCVQHARGNQFLLPQVMNRLIAGATLEHKGQTGAHVQHVTLGNTK